jgi:hypothetical protein
MFVALSGLILMTGLAAASPQLEVAKQKFVEKCLASGGSLKQGSLPDVLICTAPNGFQQMCDFTGEWAVCAGSETAPIGYDKQAAIATQKNRCDADGGTFHQGPGRNSYTCEYPDGGARGCSYGPTFFICTVKEGSGLTFSKPLLQKPPVRR